MKKQILFGLIFLISFLFIGMVIADVVSPSITTLPQSISLECGNNYNKAFSLDATKDNIISLKTQGTGSSYFMTLEKTSNALTISFF